MPAEETRADGAPSDTEERPESQSRILDRRRSRGQHRGAAGPARELGLPHRCRARRRRRRCDTSKQAPPDLILLDVMMPEVSGIEVARRVKANRSLPFIPIIMQTALDSTEDKVEGLEAGADDYITKPIDFAELKARVTVDAAHQAAPGSAARSASASCSRSNERLRHMSQTDGLTGLDNRRHLNDRLDEMFQHAERSTSRSRASCAISTVQERQRHVRPPGGRRGAQAVRAHSEGRGARDRSRRTVRRRGVHAAASRAPSSTPRVTFAERVRKQIEAHTFRSPAARCAARPASACPAGRIRGSGTATRWCARPTTRCTSRRKRDATASSASTAPNSTSTKPGRMEPTHALPPDLAQAPQTRSLRARSLTPRLMRWRASRRASPRVERERDHLAAIVDILQEVSSSLHFIDVLQTIARKLGETFGLDRCSIFLSGDKSEVRLVASYEDPSIRNLIVDLNRYPELKRAFESGETVFIPDAANDPELRSIKATLDTRNVRSIVVVPIRWEGVRHRRDLPAHRARGRAVQRRRRPLLPDGRVAHRQGAPQRPSLRDAAAQPEGRRRRAAQGRAPAYRARRLPPPPARPLRAGRGARAGPRRCCRGRADEELERLVTVAMQVLDEEAKG